MRKLTALLIVMALLVTAVPVFAQGDDIVDIAVADGRFTTLVAAVQAAGLEDTLRGEGPFTVFAPTDDAFAAALSALDIAPADLLADTATLTDILLYHVVAGEAFAADVVGLESVTTVQGSDISITVEDGNVFLNDSVQVIITDIDASNGVIHVIDFVLLPPAEEAMEEMASNTIVDIAVNDGRFTTLVAAVQAAGLVDTLAGEGPFTVFAPTDDAFAAALGALDINPADLLADTAALTDILLYHVVAGEALAADVVGLESVTTVNGLPISISVEDGNVFLNDSVQVIITDIIADNGVIHVIDFVLLPPFSVTNNGAANLNFRAGPGLDQTIIDTFPIGAKGAALARSLDSEWVQINYEGQIGWVFAPLAELSGDISELNVDANIVEIAVADGRFTTLVAAVQAAGLVDALSGEGPLTVFAPTDDAFAAALDALGVSAADLLADTETLTDILLYHVVAGEAYAADVVGLEAVTTLQGSDISITVNDNGVFLNDSVQVIITDIAANNGVIHVIDFVLLPPADDMMMEEEPGTIVDIAVADGRFTTLVAAVQAAGLVDTLAGEGPFTVFAPTDDAFAAALSALDIAPADLLADTETLTDILLYHVVAGEAYAADVVGLEAVTTVQGSDISITISDGNVFLNDSVQVIITDIAASNGVIHVIDFVLLPPAM
jgi:transforming growth factor-beta-induced protein